MSAEPIDLEAHDLALGGTRPALMPYLGMPWPDFVVFFIAGAEAAMSRWQFLIPIVAVFLGSLVLYRRDYNAGRCFLCWCQTSGRHLAASTLGGTFISPQPYPGVYRGYIDAP